MAPLPSADAVALDEVGGESVRGLIAGEAFESAEPRFVVVTREGRERVDLVFADRPIERCGLPVQREDRRVWLRFLGRTALEAGSYEQLGDEGTFGVHYELPGEHGAYESVHRGVGRVEIVEVGPRSITGRMHVCFADQEQSCISGTFTAMPCLSRIDGRALREPPGLSNDAIEATSRREVAPPAPARPQAPAPPAPGPEVPAPASPDAPPEGAGQDGP